MKYAFLLGRNPSLSIAELSTFFDETQIKKLLSNLLIVEGELPLEPQKFLNRLGGTIKIIEIFNDEHTVSESESIIIDYLKSILSPKIKNIFSVNFFGGQREEYLKKHLRSIKQALKDPFRGRFRNQHNRNVMTIVDFRDDTTSLDTDVSVIPTGQRALIGKTVAVQDVDAYSKRDYAKPFRDAKNGMLPPKLAQVMINLTSPKPGTVIADPYCGTGTILMEAALMAYPSIGSDINEEMVKGTNTNMEWLKSQFLEIKNEYKTFVKDARKLSSQDIGNKDAPLAIVSETYLGPPLCKMPSDEEFKKTTNYISELHEEVFANFSKWLQKGTHIVVLLPCFKSGNNYNLLDGLIEKLSGIGFEKQLDLSEALQNKFRLQMSKRHTLIYGRKGQTVGREIVHFVKL